MTILAIVFTFMLGASCGAVLMGWCICNAEEMAKPYGSRQERRLP